MSSQNGKKNMIEH